MKISILGINYAPEMTGIGKYSGEVAAWLAKQGFNVRVVTAPPYYPDWKVANGYSAVGYRRDRIDSVDVWRCPLYVPAKPTGLKRILLLASFAISSLPVMLRQILWKPDVVLVIEPPLFCAPAAWLAARLSGGKCWLHVQDFEVDAAFALGILPFSWMRRLVTAMESWLMCRFDAVSSISANMVQRLIQKGVSEPKALHFPNWVDLDAVKYDEAGTKAFRQQYRIPEGAFVVLYAGNLGEKQGLEIVIDAAQKLAVHKEMVFILCGEGAAKPRLLASTSGLDNVRFLPLQPIDKLNDLLNAANIHLLPQRADAADLVMPSKLTGILASGRPVVATAHPGTEVWNVVQGRGLTVEPGNSEAFAGAIRQLAEDAALRESLGQAAREYAVAELDKEKVLRKFEVDLLRLVEGRV